MELDYSIYDTDAWQVLEGFRCDELAKSLDRQGTIFYMEYDRNKDYAILGSNLKVQIIGGREERRTFIEKIKIEEISAKRIFKFYERAKEAVEGIKYHRCKVLGLYERGDFERFFELRRLSINEELVKRIIGKLVIGENVRIKCSDASKSISLISEIIERLRENLHLFKFAASELPKEADVIISRHERFEGDVDFDKKEIKINRVFEKIYKIYEEMGKRKYMSKEEMSYDILREAVKRFPEEICALENKIGKIMILCDDIQTLERLIRCVRNKGIRIRGEVAYTLMDKWAERVYGKNGEIESFLIDLYMEQGEKGRRGLTKLLVKRGVFWREVVKDAISAIYDRDENMLREFAGKSFKSKEFEGYVGEALEDLKFRGGNLREFLRFILNNEGWITGRCGEVLVKAIYDMLEEGERRKLGRKYEQELRNFGIEPEVRYEEINLRRVIAFLFAMMIIGFTIGVLIVL